MTRTLSALATEHKSINLGQGFPDTDGPEDVVQAAADALKDGRNQYPPMPGVPAVSGEGVAGGGSGKIGPLKKSAEIR